MVIPPNYNVALGFAASSAFISLGVGNIALGVPVGLIALLLFVQTGRVRFAFDDEALEVLVSKKVRYRYILCMYVCMHAGMYDT